MSMEYFDPELDLLADDPGPAEDTASASSHALRTAPVFTGDAFEELTHHVFPQRALYAKIVSQHTASSSEPDELVSPKLYINTNSPFSALVCGLQGSGKSHSTSVFLESSLIDDNRIGTLPAPLSAMVFHFDTAAGGGAVQPCEAAYLSTLDPVRGAHVKAPPVTVLVVPTYLKAMRKVYAGLPDVRVEPLLFSPDDISGERLLAMMKVDENAQMPLYMESIMAILRGMEDNFSYRDFREQIGLAKFNGSQKAMLNLRLSLLDSCLNGGDSSNSIKNHFQPGQLTIIDLSSPFMDGASACGFFDIILGLYVEAEIGGSGKMVVLDEAHKYLSESQSGTSGRLTDSLLTVIRQQRHLATRVIISTQEPTVVPSKFLDLCSIIIAHRFSSPKWLKTLAEHVSAADSSLNELFDKIVSLQTGQAIMFAPNGLCVRSRAAAVSASTWNAETEAEQPPRNTAAVGMLGQGYLVVRSRLRLTLDGGHSLLAVTTPGMSTRLGRVSGRAAGETRESQTSSVPTNLPTPVPSPDSASRFNTGTIRPATFTSSSTPNPAARTAGTGASWTATSLQTQVPTSLPTPAHATTTPSFPPNRHINMKTVTHKRYAPMLKYVTLICKGGAFVRLSTLVRYFKNKKAGLYGSDDNSIMAAVSSAVQLGILVQFDGDSQRIAIDRAATYVP